MSLFKRKNNSPKPPSDGPAEWAAKARANDERILREREAAREAERVEMAEAQLRKASEAVGAIAISSGENTEHSLTPAPTKAAEKLSGKPESRKDFFPLEVLNEEFLRHFAERKGYVDGKFIRVGNTIFLTNSIATVHRDILDFGQKAMEAQEQEDTGEQLLGPKGSGLVDAGKYDAFFDSADNTSGDDGTVGQFTLSGYSEEFGVASKEGRDRTVEIARQVLGEHILTVAGDPRM